MSLVSDALRRARQEAAAREGGAVPLPAAARPAPMMAGRRGVAAGVVLAVAGLVVVALFLWPRAAALPGEPAVRIAPVQRAPQEAPLRLPVVAVPLPPPEVSAAESESATTAVAPMPPTAADQVAVGESAAAADPTPAAAAAAPADSGSRDVFARAELGYATLELDYIAYRADAPFAQVNGREVVVGSMLLGFTVEEITADAVRLRDDRGPLVLRAKR